MVCFKLIRATLDINYIRNNGLLQINKDDITRKGNGLLLNL
jgi:hypothetical protein